MIANQSKPGMYSESFQRELCFIELVRLTKLISPIPTPLPQYDGTQPKVRLESLAELRVLLPQMSSVNRLCRWTRPPSFTFSTIKGQFPVTKKWAVERTRTIQGLVDFIKKFLKLMASEQLFIYVNQSFAPSPDQEVGTLYECFGSDGKLVLHYCKTQAWG
ncbi:autophagy related 12 [Columba livia]|uniref:Ubiquitin-like protein ATG12 n=1 Tax=Columba livia TaxID=8932 RepID=A0A2I0M8S4_COLLI|nr:ubiquitin-like protein ATG12 [Columba livia]PKK26076.1 autophagy related 12 [Columba livia]